MQDTYIKCCHLMQASHAGMTKAIVRHLLWHLL